MRRSATHPQRRPAGLAALDDAGGALPPVSSRERDFWRRAVAEERARLELKGSSAPADLPAELH
jgi:hypothetical protein